MADSNLNTPVIVQATRLDTSILPRNIFSQSYLLYVIAQGTDVGNVANKANEAGQGAYDAQVRNDEQDVILVDHEERIRQLRIEVPESCCCGGDGWTWFDSHKQSTGYDRADTRSVLVIKSDEQLQQSGKRWAWCAARSGKRRADVRQQHEQHCTAKRSTCRC